MNLKLSWLFLSLAILILAGCADTLTDYSGKSEKTTTRVGIWQDCNPKINNCEEGLRCEHYYKDVYRCIKYLKEGEECGKSVAEKCEKDLECTNTFGTKQTCNSFECVVDRTSFCLRKDSCKGYINIDGSCVETCPEGLVAAKLTDARNIKFCVPNEDYQFGASYYCETDSDCQPACGLISGNIGREPCLNKFYIEQNPNEFDSTYCQNVKGKRCGSCECDKLNNMIYGNCERKPTACPK